MGQVDTAARCGNGPLALLLRIASLYLALFLSGAAALVYQSTWGRMLQRVFGVSDLAVATVLATFFLGLGLGSAAGGRWGSKVERPARLYALLEIAIGAWALLSLVLIPRVHDLYAAIGGGSSFGLLTIVRFVIALFILLPPTLLMGATLPVLIAAVARRGVSWSSSATWLYATNTFGAVIGAGITGLYLVPTFGAKFSIVVAAGASFSAAAIVFVLWHTTGAKNPSGASAQEATGADDRGPTAAAAAVSSDARSSIRLAMTAAFVAGVASLASEVLWTRTLRLVVQGTTQAFAAMLVNFLVGIALGSLVAERLMRRPGRDPAKLFALTQLLLAVLTVVAIFVGSQLPRLSVLVQGTAEVVPHEAWVILALSAVLLLPLALVLGTSVPLAWRIAGGDASEAADHSGRVLAANTLGGLLGSLCAGFVLIPGYAHLLEGTSPSELRVSALELSLMTVMGIHLIAATLVLRARARTLAAKVTALTGPLALGVALVAIGPSLNLPFLLDAWYDPTTAVISGPEEHWRDNVVFLREGRNTTVTILDRDQTLRLFNDGRPESGFGADEPGFGEELVVLGSLPSVFAHDRGRAMAIGLGAGHTTAVLLGGPWREVHVVELEGAVVDAARFLYEARERPFPLDDDRTRLIVDDARAQLVLADAESYDAIVSQPSHPWLAGSSALYTQEFFLEVERALTDGGVLSLWTNLFRIDIEHLRSIVATLLEVFDHVRAFVVEDSSFILIAGNDALPLDQEAAERLSYEGLRPFLRPFSLDDLVDYAAGMELDTAGAQAFAAGGDIIVDDRPALEFDLARIPHLQDLSRHDVDYALSEIPWITPETFAAVPEELRTDLLINRVEYVVLRRRAILRVRASLANLDMPAADRHLVEGVIAEYLGDVSGALEHYDAALTDDRAAYRADQLRSAERLHRSLLATLDRPRSRPTSLRPFLIAALELRDASAARRGIAMHEEVGNPADEPWVRFARAWADGSCEALRSVTVEAPQVLDELPAALEAARCAFAAGDEDAGLRYMRAYHRAARAEAARNGRDGREAHNAGNNGLAMCYFRRALAAYPAHAASAAALARMLHGLERDEEATRVLRRAYEAARGLPSAEAALRGAAEELGVSLD